MIIKILGSGCKKCISLTENTQQALHNLGLTADVVKVTDFAEIAAHGVMSTPALAIDDKVQLTANASRTFDLLANDRDASDGGLHITKINGVAVTAGQTVTLATGETVTLNADGTVTVHADADIGSWEL